MPTRAPTCPTMPDPDHEQARRHPDHGATRAFAKAAATRAKVDLGRARLALRTLRLDQRQASAAAAAS